MKKLILLLLIAAASLSAQTVLDTHEWGNNSGRWWSHVDTTYYKGLTGYTTIGGNSFLTWPYASLFLTLADTVTTDSEDSTCVSICVYQSPVNDLTTAVFVDSLTFKGTGVTTYTNMTATGRYGTSLDVPFLECRYTWFRLHKQAGNRTIKYNRCISTWTGWNGTSGIISTY